MNRALTPSESQDWGQERRNDAGRRSEASPSSLEKRLENTSLSSEPFENCAIRWEILNSIAPIIYFSPTLERE